MTDQGLNSEKERLNEKKARHYKLVQYKPEFCEEIIKAGEEGGTFQDFGLKIGRTRHTLYYWGKMHPEFRKAMDISYRKRERYFGMDKEDRKSEGNNEKDKEPKADKVCRCEMTGPRVKPNYEIIFEEEIIPQEGGDGTEAKKTRHILQTKYRSEFCEIMIQMAEEGRGLKEFCAKIRVRPKTVRDWGKTIPEFQEAVILAKLALDTYLMDAARKHMVYRFDFNLWRYMVETSGGYRSIVSDDEIEEETVKHVLILPELEPEEGPGEAEEGEKSDTEGERENGKSGSDMESAGDSEEGTQVQM